MGVDGERLGRRGIVVFVRRRAAQGWGRMRAAAIPVAEAAAAAGLAWLFATKVLGHPTPFFAPVAAWLCLGSSRVRDLRNVVELAAGVSLGVALGDVLVHLIGSGAVQIACVLFLGAMLARFIDRGQMLTGQAGVQALIIVAFPVAGGMSPVWRWTDALTGGLMALVIVVAIPHDPRVPLRDAASRGLGELAAVCAALAEGMRTHNPHRVHDALVRGRASQDVFTDWFVAARRARQLTAISLRRRQASPEVDQLARMATYADRAIRNARVVARRGATILVDIDGSPASKARIDALAEATEAMALAARSLADAARKGYDGLVTRRAMVLRAAALLTADLAGESWQPRTYVLLLRSMSIDLLQACGMSRTAARQARPTITELGDAA
jgi:uncharacterized membrane protein YgaE (UPF0421/DUF939 family)